MSKVLKSGYKIKINSGAFKGVVGELIDIDWGYGFNRPSIFSLKVDDNNIVKLDIDNTEVEVIDDFPKRFKMNENNNCITIRSNNDINGWEDAIKVYKEDINDSVIYIETNNYSDDEEEIVDMVTAISVPQAKYLVNSLNEIVEYIEKKGKKNLVLKHPQCENVYGIVGEETPFKYDNGEPMHVGDVVKITYLETNRESNEETMVVKDGNKNTYEIMGIFGSMDNINYKIQGWKVKLVKKYDKLQVGSNVRGIEVIEE